MKTRTFKGYVNYESEVIEIEVNVPENATQFDIDKALEKEAIEHFITHKTILSEELVQCEFCGERIAKDEINDLGECPYCE